MSICKNKAHEVLRKNSKVAVVEDDIPLSLIDENFKEDKINALISYDNNDFEEEKEKLVSEIVQNLPSPCDELLWGFYRDELSMKTLAQKLNYSEGSIKVIKHRCCEKFRIRYQELANNLF
jgi:RNA polymerase sigma factor (sigma-70 family)